MKKMAFAAMAIMFMAFFSSCEEKEYDLRVVITGDTGGQGTGVYGNGKRDFPLDYDRLGPDDKVFFILNGENQKLDWNPELQAFTFTLPKVSSKSQLNFAITRPALDPLAPKNMLEPVYGIYVDVMDKDKVLCTEEMIHYTTGSGFFGPEIKGFGSGWKCLNQEADNRTVLVKLP